MKDSLDTRRKDPRGAAHATPLLLLLLLLAACSTASGFSHGKEGEEQAKRTDAAAMTSPMDEGRVSSVCLRGGSASTCSASRAPDGGASLPHTDATVGDASDVWNDDGECPSQPTAYLLARDEDAHGAAEQLLSNAGFVVEPLPLDRSPADLRGLILLGSDSSSRASYRDYMSEYAADLYHFVDRANTLVQMSQAAADEDEPAFLPTTQEAQRQRGDVTALEVLQPDTQLLRGVTLEDVNASLLEATHAPFVRHSGFAVFARSAGTRDALLLEGAYGQGRIVLSALPLDALDLQPDVTETSDAFLRNLRTKTRDVCQRSTEALLLEQSRFSDRFTAGSSALALLPDTQVYSLRLPGLFLLQAAWLVEHAASLDVRYALHLGDIVNNNTDLEWRRAHEAMSLLSTRVPYALVPGNHDYGPSGDASTRDTLLNDHFDFELHARAPGFGGAYEDGKLDNTYHLIEISGRSLVVVALEWGPRDEVIDWANAVMEQHSDREGVLITHAYLNNDDRRYDHTDTEHSQQYNPHNYRTPGGVNDGEELWQKLVKRHRFILTVNGHVLGDGTGYLASETEVGNTCHQILVNYQMREQGGEAYLRLLEFLPDQRTVRVHSYSPLLDEFLEHDDQLFEFELD